MEPVITEFISAEEAYDLFMEHRKLISNPVTLNEIDGIVSAAEDDNFSLATKLYEEYRKK